MAVDKLVDSAQLNSDLTSVANAIRTKGGTSAQLAFPAGFVSAVNNIPSGGGGLSVVDVLQGDEPSGVVSFKATKSLPQRAISGRNNITELTIDLTSGYVIGQYGIVNNPGIELIVAIHKSTYVNADIGNYGVNANSNLTKFISRGQLRGVAANGMRSNSKLAIIDFEYLENGLTNSNVFNGNSAFKTIILRQNSVVPIGTGTFTSTPFASASGAVAYVPSSLISSYKQANNWSTMFSNGYVTFTAIEGSQYASLDWYK